jgi:hypothetical protein
MIRALADNGIGIEKNQEFANVYTSMALDAGSFNGLFWFGVSCDTHEKGDPFFKEAAEKGHIVTKWVIALRNMNSRIVPNCFRNWIKLW